MNRLARCMQATIWTVLVLALVACAAPASPTPVPSRTPVPAPSPSPSPTATRTAVPSVTPTTQRPAFTPLPSPSPSATAPSRQYEDVDARAILVALFPGLPLTQNGDEFVVNGNPSWMLWVNSRSEGRFTQSGVSELAVIIANEGPQMTPEEIQRVAPWGSFLAVLQRRGGRIEVVQKSFLFPTAISPLAFDVKIDRVVDFDHDDKDELLIATEVTRMGISSTAAFLFQWNDPAFAEVWSAPTGEDNTGAINQLVYYAATSQIHFADLEGTGVEDIILDTLWVNFARDAQGLANVDRETSRRTERHVFRWTGTAFAADPSRATPLPPLPTPTP